MLEAKNKYYFMNEVGDKDNREFSSNQRFNEREELDSGYSVPRVRSEQFESSSR